MELIVDAAPHAPSGANAQPWHFVAEEWISTTRHRVMHRSEANVD